MSMSEDGAGRMVETGKNKTGLTDPNAIAADSPPAGGQPGTGLPGLAAFGNMQTYMPSTVPPPEEPAQDQYQPDAMAGTAEQLEQALAPEDNADAAVTEYATTYSDDHEGDAGQQEYADDALAPGEAADPTNGAQAYEESADGEEDADYYPEENYTDGEFQPYMAGNDATATEQYQDYTPETASGDAGEMPEYNTQNALQSFEAHYDQHPEVPLGSLDEPVEQPFFHQEGQQDADFLEPGYADEQMPLPKERNSRKAVMFSAGLVGALALGGALAFAYKTGGSPQLAEGGAPPLIQADSRPVKVAPEQPGGKQFPHQNKQIYDRLQGEQKAEVEKIVPRQEQVASAPSGAGVDADRAAQTPAQSGQAVASLGTGPAQQGTSPGAPHKVKTLQVRPDGSVVSSQEPAAAAQPADSGAPVPGTNIEAAAPVPVPMPPAAAADPAPAPAAVDQTTVASVPQIPAQESTPVPVAPAEAAAPQQQVAAVNPPVQAQPPAQAAPLPQPKPVRTASAPAQPATAASAPVFVVQVASRRSQAMALAAFADLQQKYTSLLGTYRPMIQSANLGDKGTWYRLRVGPMKKKAEAETLCKKLRGAGLRSCLVRPL